MHDFFKVIADADTRDKWIKLLQYSTKVLSDFPFMSQIGGTLGDARKVFRMTNTGQLLNVFMDKCAERSMNPDNCKYWVNDQTSRLFMLIFWVFDFLALWAKRLPLPINPEDATRSAGTGWFLSAIANAVLQVRKIADSAVHLNETDEDDDKVSESILSRFLRHKEALINLFRILLDIFVAAALSGIYSQITGRDANKRKVGLAGVLSAVLVIRSKSLNL